MMSSIRRAALSNAVTLVIAPLSGRGGEVLDPAVPVRAARKLMLFDALTMTRAIIEHRYSRGAAPPASTMLGANRTDWLQSALLAVAFLSTVALFSIDIYG